MNTTIATPTVTNATVMLSRKGMRELQKAIAQLEHDRHNIQRSLHDIDRGFSRDDRLARIERLSQLDTIENELIEKREVLANAKLIPTKRARAQVAIGSVVDIIDQQGRLFRYTLVDTIEANPSDGRISILSPLGQSLLGKTVKDIVQWGNGLRTNSGRLIRIA